MQVILTSRDEPCLHFTRVSISAIGSVIVIDCLLSDSYILPASSLRTPGISLYANSRKQIRHNLNLRYTECGRPQRSQRVFTNSAFLFLLLSNHKF